MFGFITTKERTLNIITDVLGGRWRGLEEVPFYTGIPMTIFESQFKKEQQIPEIPEVVSVNSQLPSSPQQSVITPMTTGVLSPTQSVEAPKAEAGELKLAGFPVSIFLLVGLGLVAISFFGVEKHVS